MASSSSHNITNESKLELDKNKQNYINAITLSKRLSDRYAGHHGNLRYVFHPETCRLREKFKQICETLLLEDPIDYGLKIIDLLWRKGAYDPIQIFKRDRQEHDETTLIDFQITYRMHLSATFSFYTNLLIKFSSMIKPYQDWNRFLDFMRLAVETKSVNVMRSENLVESLSKLIHKCLIGLGDLSRYLSEYDDSSSLAEKYYRMAILLDPEIGIPLNQLGSLSGRVNSSCDAAFYYLLCLSTTHPFDGAQENLQMLFKRNEKRLLELTKQQMKNRNENASSHREIRHFLVEFLRVIHHLLDSNNIGQMQDLGQQTLNDFNACMFYQNELMLSDDLVFKLLSIAMIVVDRIRRIRSRTVKQPVLFAAIAFAVALFSHIVDHTLIRLQNAFYQLHDARTKTNEGDSDDEEEQRQAAAKEKRRRMKMMMSRRRRRSASSSERSDASERSLSDERYPQRNDSSDEDASEEEIPDYLSGDSSDEENVQMKKAIREEKDKEAEELAIKVALEEFMEKIKQSGALFHSNDTQSTQTSLFSFTDLSAHLFAAFASNDCPSPLFADQISPTDDPYSMSLYSDDQSSKSFLTNNKEIYLPPGFEHDSGALAAAEIEQKLAEFELEPFIENLTNDNQEHLDNNDQTTRHHSAKLILELLENENVLPVIKVFCDWLAGNKRLLQMLLPISTGLWSKLAMLLNFLPHEQDILKSGLISSNSSIHPLLVKFVETKMFVTLPPMLDEDIQLRPFQALKVDRNHQKLNLNDLSPLNKLESTVIRVCSLRRFGYHLSSLLSNSLFTYDHEKLSFTVAAVPEPMPMTKQEPIPVKIDPAADNERKNRLMRDMAALRLQAEISQLENSLKNEEFSLPPYLVMDSTVLCQSLNSIQQLVQSQRFIIVIPLVVIDSLDELKKQQREARDAIRWLENQFRQGNRFIRTQAVHERLNTSTNTTTKKSHKNKEFFRFQEMVDCCLYFAQQGNAERSASSNITTTTTSQSISTVNLLMARSLTNKEQQIVDKEGIVVQHIDDFNRRWRQLTPEK